MDIVFFLAFSLWSDTFIRVHNQSGQTAGIYYYSYMKYRVPERDFVCVMSFCVSDVAMVIDYVDNRGGECLHCAYMYVAVFTI